MSGTTKLTRDEILMYLDWGYTQGEIASYYGVSQPAISQVAGQTGVYRRSAVRRRLTQLFNDRRIEEVENKNI